jgi:hypothetical protein
MMRKEIDIPLKPEVKDRKTRFEVLNEVVRSRNGWITSVPGDVDVTIECLPGSSLPDELRAQGYGLTATGDGERIVPTAIIERFRRGADGVLELLTSGSTRPVAQVVTHAGICTVKRYAFHARPSTPNVFNVGTIVERWPIWPSKAWKWGFWDYCTQPTLGVNLRQASGRPSEPFTRWMSCNRTALLPIFLLASARRPFAF